MPTEKKTSESRYQPPEILSDDKMKKERKDTCYSPDHPEKFGRDAKGVKMKADPNSATYQRGESRNAGLTDQTLRNAQDRAPNTGGPQQRQTAASYDQARQPKGPDQGQKNQQQPQKGPRMGRGA